MRSTSLSNRQTVVTAQGQVSERARYGRYNGCTKHNCKTCQHDRPACGSRFEVQTSKIRSGCTTASTLQLLYATRHTVPLTAFRRTSRLHASGLMSDLSGSVQGDVTAASCTKCCTDTIFFPQFGRFSPANRHSTIATQSATALTTQHYHISVYKQ